MTCSECGLALLGATPCGCASLTAAQLRAMLRLARQHNDKLGAALTAAQYENKCRTAERDANAEAKYTLGALFEECRAELHTYDAGAALAMMRKRADSRF